MNKKRSGSKNYQKNNINNMNQKELKTETIAKTGLITKIILAVAAIIAIGLGIWYFAAIIIADNEIKVTEKFESNDDQNLVVKNEAVYDNQNFGRLLLESNKDSFSRDLSEENTNYLCPNGLKGKIESIEITAKDGISVVRSTWLKSNPGQLQNLIKIKINGQEINSEAPGLGQINLQDYFHNFDSITWSDLLRWSSDNPNALLAMNNGSVIPVFKGKSNIKVGICGKVSQPLELQVDDDSTSDKTTFDNLTTAGLGTEKAMFSNKFVNKILLSNDLGEIDLPINKVTGILRSSFRLSDLRLFFSFDDGETWTRVTMSNSTALRQLGFSYEVQQGTGKKLRYALVYEFNEQSGSLSQPYADLLQGGEVGLKVKVNEFGLMEDRKILFLNQDNVTVETGLSIVDDHVKRDNVYYSNHLMEPFKSKNPGLSNYQRYVYKGINCNQPDDIAVDCNTLESSATATIVTLPAEIELEELSIKATGGGIINPQCPEGQELVDGVCTTPLPPDDNDPECNDDFKCPEGQIRQGCLKSCLGPDPLFCEQGKVIVNGECKSIVGEENEPALMVDAKEFQRGSNRTIITWKVGKDELKNQNLTLEYGTFDPQNIKTDDVGNPVLEEKNTANAIYNKDKDYYYAVLKNLKGGEFSDKNDQGYVNGRKPYVFQISMGDKHAKATNFKTLNRFQTILYYYNLVLGDTFDLEKYEQPDKSLRSGGPDFFYKPEGQEPLSLKGVHFTILNDRKFKEFDNRISATSKKIGNKKTIEELYRRVHDRIYDDNLEKFSDPTGVAYWTKQVERNDDNRIDILGVKFAISVSPEATGNISALPAAEQAKANANLAYQIVLKRGADQKGLENLLKAGLQGNPLSSKAMRELLAESGEYDSRLKSIKGRRSQIEELYETLYARAADVAGVNYWDQSGKSIQKIKQEFLKSADFSKVTQ